MNQQTAVANRPAQGQDVATQEATHPLTVLREQLETRSAEIKMALPAHISPEKFQRTVTTAVQQNPGLLTASRTSLILACMKAAHDGLLPDGREAALVEFKRSFKEGGQWKSVRDVAYIPMVYGVRKKILQSRDATGKPVVSALEVGVVYRREHEEKYFYYEVGKFPPLGHRLMIDLQAEDTTDDKIIGAYSIATMADGTKSYEFMRRFELDKIREASQTGATKNRDGSPRDSKGPWKDWFPEMCKKTVLRRHAKSLPQSGDLIIEADDDEDYAGQSTALVLGSASEDEATLIEHDQDGTAYDGATGEVIEGERTDQAVTSEDGTATAEQSGEEAEEGAETGGATESEEQTETSTEESEDEGLAADQRHAHEKMFEQLVGDIVEATKTAKAARDAYLGCELERASLPDDLNAELDARYERHLASFKPAAPRQAAREPAE